MSARGAGSNDRMVRPLQPMADGHLARNQVDDVAWDEEGRDPARPALVEAKRVFGDALDAANTGADHHAGGAAVGFGLGLPSGIFQGLIRGGYAVENEVADLAQFLRLQNRFGIDRAAGSVSPRNDMRDLAGQIINLESGDPARGAAPGQQLLPAMLEAHAERRKESESGYDDTPHRMPVSADSRMNCVRPKPCRCT